MSLSNTLQVVPVTTLNSHEEREDLDKWWGILKAQLKTSRYKDYMYKTWIAKNADPNRGFTEVEENGKTVSASEQSEIVQDMLETITGYIPHMTSSPIVNNAVSLAWVYEYLKTHFGYDRSSADLMRKFVTLERKPGERIRAYWCRFEAFYEDNKIRKDPQRSRFRYRSRYRS